MQVVTYSDIHGKLSDERLAALPALEIAVLRNVVVEPIEPYLRYRAYEIGFNARCAFGEYDNVFQEAVDGGRGLLDKRTDCVLVFVRLENISWDLARNFAGMTDAQIDGEKDRIERFAGDVLTGIRNQTNAMILWAGFELPVHPALGVADYQIARGQASCIAEVNERVRHALRAHRNAYFLDTNVCLARVGASHFYDARYWHLARAPYSRHALEELSAEAFKYIRALVGKSRKCLVLDCDNVLWGGIVGEDGLAGIRLARTYPGSAYREFQQEIVNHYHRGVIVALCSRNNEADVWEVFAQHPDMILRREHIAAARINWDDKTSNLRSLAAELNVGLDSFVFLDDSPFETEQVRQYLPEVQVVDLPQDRAVDYRDILAAGGWFDTLTLSQEDRSRGAMYRAEAERRELQAQTPDLESYFASLAMVLEVRIADPFSFPRVAQLTQKTNQFNLTTRRYSDAQIHELGASESADVLHVQLKDRFGESGLAGVCILRYEADRAIIDTFLLSCRVLGRGVEDAFLTQCLLRAQRRGSRSAIGVYVPTPKNAQVEDFFLRRAFRPAGGDGACLTFELDLAAYVGRTPPWFERVDSQVAHG